MLCQSCSKRPAKIHLTKIINDEKKEIHLCEVCAQENTQIGYDYPFTLNNFLSSLFDIGFPLKDSQIGQLGIYKCRGCGLTFEEFKKSGKFGCADCYSAFNDKLLPILKRLHGNVHHSGKLPQRVGGALKIKKEVERLKSQLNKAIKEEQYEKAAQLRDRIKELEKCDKQ